MCGPNTDVSLVDELYVYCKQHKVSKNVFIWIIVMEGNVLHISRTHDSILIE